MSNSCQLYHTDLVYEHIYKYMAENYLLNFVNLLFVVPFMLYILYINIYIYIYIYIYI